MESVFEKLFIFEKSTVEPVALLVLCTLYALFISFLGTRLSQKNVRTQKPAPLDESDDTNGPCKSFTDRFRELDSNQQEVVLERLEAVCRELKNPTSKRVN